jgi:hypothetical protein
MPPPSNLPSAAKIAADAKQKYDALYGATRPALAPGIEDQADFFFRQGQLATVYLGTLVDLHVFDAPPNEGHSSIADLLLVGGIQTAATTNVDMMIETAGMQLFGHVGRGIDRAAITSLPPTTSPLLKLHGCRHIDYGNTVWTHGQLATPPVAERIAFATEWLPQRLLNRDLIFVGYWTDWDYLNGIFARVFNAVHPARVIVVDPADGATIQRKAPELYALGESVPAAFKHVRVSGATFFAELRKQFSNTIVRRILHSGVAAFEEAKHVAPDPALTEPPDLDNEALWRMRRDLEGCRPNDPARMFQPPTEPLLGLTLLQLRANGAVPSGPYWNLGGKLIRVLRTANVHLHTIEAVHVRDTAPAVAPAITIAVGAESQNLPSSIVRAGTRPTIARGSASRWLTRGEAVEELNL